MKARVQNFRSAEDSDEFTLEHSTCLVGKNEAGKTAILQALAGLNAHPATPFEYEVERDYPKRYLARYSERHSGEEALVISTEWEISDETKDKLVAEFGEAAVTGKKVTIKRHYNSGRSWTVPIDVTP
ncbi:MAG: AAA family ATPase [Erythrobacter sp.]|nr:AAA family ATPase [Erythrobacter sp.]